MLIRSNRPFQSGGNGQTEESRPLIDLDRRNGGWKQMVGCQESLPFSFPSLLTSCLSLPFMNVSCSLVMGDSGLTGCLGHSQINTAIPGRDHSFP